MFYPSEVELAQTADVVLREVEATRPSRVVFDSLSEMRMLAQNPLRYRRQILALKQFFVGRQCTVLLLDDRTAGQNDIQVQSIVHGVITLERRTPDYGVMQRRLQVLKMRGKATRPGLPRLRDPARRPARVPAARRRPSTRLDVRAGALPSGLRGARPSRRRRPRPRDERAVRRTGGHRQVDVRDAIRRRDRAARRARRDVPVRRGRSHAAGARRGPRHRPRRAARRTGTLTSGRSTRASCRPASSCSSCATRSRSEGSAHDHHRQPQRLPQRHARRALPDAPAARAPDLPQPARRHRRSS